MGEEVPEWATMWGARVKMPIDMSDDMLKDGALLCRSVVRAAARPRRRARAAAAPPGHASPPSPPPAITTVSEKLAACEDFEKDGLALSEEIKKKFDASWGPSWHVILGRNFGSFVTHETRCFIYFYVGNVAIMMYKS